MKKFMDEDFLLTSDAAKKLYHDYAENMPIVDYHCHINPQEICEDRKFENITQVCPVLLYIKGWGDWDNLWVYCILKLQEEMILLKSQTNLKNCLRQ